MRIAAAQAAEACHRASERRAHARDGRPPRRSQSHAVAKRKRERAGGRASALADNARALEGRRRWNAATERALVRLCASCLGGRRLHHQSPHAVTVPSCCSAESGAREHLQAPLLARAPSVGPPAPPHSANPAAASVHSGFSSVRCAPTPHHRRCPRMHMYQSQQRCLPAGALAGPPHATHAPAATSCPPHSCMPAPRGADPLSRRCTRLRGRWSMPDAPEASVALQHGV